jgi:integrase
MVAGGSRDLRHGDAELGASVDLEPLAAHREHLEWWQRTLEDDGRSSATRALRLAAVSGLFAAALDLGLVDRNPADRVRRPRLRDDLAPGRGPGSIRRKTNGYARTRPQRAFVVGG